MRRTALALILGFAAFTTIPAVAAENEQPAEPDYAKIAAELEQKRAALNDMIRLRGESNAAHVAHQLRINSADDEIFEDITAIRQARERLENLRAYNAELTATISGQEQDIARLDQDISRASQLQRAFLPLMARMLDGLESFVQLDHPFDQSGRLARVDNLRSMLSRADITQSEKFRRVLEAYEIESDFGRTVDVSVATITLDGVERTGEVLRMGRIGLFFITGDGSVIAVWDNDRRSWSVLPRSMEPSLRHAIDVAERRIPPDLMYLPMPAPEVTP